MHGAWQHGTNKRDCVRLVERVTGYSKRSADANTRVPRPGPVGLSRTASTTRKPFPPRGDVCCDAEMQFIHRVLAVSVRYVSTKDVSSRTQRSVLRARSLARTPYAEIVYAQVCTARSPGLVIL